MNIGILGFAHGHVYCYLERWRDNADMGVDVTAGWDHDEARLSGAVKHYGIQAHSTAEALLSDGVDAVVVAAETSLHAELVEKAAQSGKSIILQKPMSLTMAEADRIVKAVNDHNVPFTMAWQMRVDPQNLKIRELIESGRFGRLFMVRRRHGLGVNLDPGFADSWHLNPEYNRDIWADDAAHPIDFMYWLFGKPRTVWAEMATFHNPKAPNDNGIAVFRYEDGPLAVVSCSFTCHAGENTTEVIAENGVIIQNCGDAPSAGNKPPGAIALKWFLQDEGKWTVSDLPDVDGQGDRIADLAGPFADFLNGKRGPIATAEEGRDALGMVLACYESQESGKRIKMS
jgi:predicted dehydrogenase